MRRRFAAILCAVVLLLAGCQGFDTGQATPTANRTETPGEVVRVTFDENNTTELPASGINGSEGALSDDSSVRPDPETDQLGWENGYWHNESLNVTSSDGLNETERGAIIDRSMARVEYIRGLEFDGRVPVETVSRDEYQANSSGTYGESLEQFDNAKFEALFLIGEGEESISVQESNLGASVLGYYSPAENAIVIVTESETPTISEQTLGHELVHALQDQQFGLENSASTRDALQGRNGLIEGDATNVGEAYSERCGAEWECLSEESAGGGGGDRHAGLSFLFYFPYSDGTDFVSELRDRGGWEAVNDAYDGRPDGAREVITPEDYPRWEPRNVTLPDETDDNWERVRPSTDRDRPDYAVVGPSAIAATMAYTLADDYNRSAVVSSSQVVNYDPSGGLDSTDPYNYDLPMTSNWEGGRMNVYTNGSESAYVWRTSWSKSVAAETFADAWADVIQHWGGTETAEGNWVIAEDSPYTDAIAIHVDGDTVTVVNAPTEAQLSELYDA